MGNKLRAILLSIILNGPIEISEIFVSNKRGKANALGGEIKRCLNNSPFEN